MYSPKTHPLATELQQQSTPDTPSAIEPFDAAPRIPVTTASPDGYAEKQRPKNAVRKLTYAAAALYFTVVVAALFLHQHENAEAKIVKEVEEVQAQLVDLVFNRAQRSPRMVELLKWPEGASDRSVEGFIRRSDELGPLLSNELTAGKKVQEHALQVLAQIPADNPNHARAVLVAQAAEDDIHLYESYLLEVSLADKARLKSPAVCAGFVNSGLIALDDQENADLKRRQDTLERLQ